jgi:hypothetical protein
MNISFPFPRHIDSVVAGLEEAKNFAGKTPPPDSDAFDIRLFYGTGAHRVK